MSKRIKPVMGHHAKSYIGKIKSDADADIADLGSNPDTPRRDLRLIYCELDVGDVREAADFIEENTNPYTCMTEQQATNIRDKILILDDDISIHVAAWSLIPIINSFRLDCENCLKKNCLYRSLQAPYEEVMTRADPELKEVKDVNFSVRTSGILCSAGIITLGDLRDFSKAELLKLKNFGLKSLKEVRTVLAKHGLLLNKDA